MNLPNSAGEFANPGAAPSGELRPHLLDLESPALISLLSLIDDLRWNVFGSHHTLPAGWLIARHKFADGGNIWQCL